jgi:hypothetical protein
MNASSHWRQKYLTLTDELRRDCGLAAETVSDDPDAALTLSIDVGDVRFDTLHFAGDGGTGRFLIQCCFGVVPRERAADILKRALQSNQLLARTQTAMFALNAENDELVYSFFQSLEDVSAPDLLEGMAHIAEFAKAWREANQLPVHGARHADHRPHPRNCHEDQRIAPSTDHRFA